MASAFIGIYLLLLFLSAACDATLRLTLRAAAPSPSLSRQPGPHLSELPHLSPLTRFRCLCLSLPLCHHPCPQALRLMAFHRRRPVTSTGP
jgi:hypothetical protein